MSGERSQQEQPWHQAKGSQIPQHDYLPNDEYVPGEPTMIGIAGITGELRPTNEPPYLEAVASSSIDQPTSEIAKSPEVTFNPIVVGKSDGSVQPIRYDKTMLMRLNPKDRAKFKDGVYQGENGNSANGAKP